METKEPRTDQRPVRGSRAEAGNLPVGDTISIVFPDISFALLPNHFSRYDVSFLHSSAETLLLMSSQLDSYVSPIGADVPQIDFSVTLKNYDKYFNVDNPKSTINFLETGQEMDIYYGYHLPESDEIEWVRGNHLVMF